MASTYSTSLRLELIGTGEQSGTWGATTNVNLGTLLEQAITGYLSVAQGDVANLTLTNTDGATNQARNAIVELTGALTAIRNVVVPTAPKLYWIKNSTTGGFSIVVKTTAGTGVSIAPSQMMPVFCDGTNVVAGPNFMSGSLAGVNYLDAGALVGPTWDLFRDSTSPAASDLIAAVTLSARTSTGVKIAYGTISGAIEVATNGAQKGVLYQTVANTAGDPSLEHASTGAGVATWSPTVNGNGTLGTASKGWAALHLLEGAAINWDNGDVTLTQTGNLLELAGTTNFTPGTNDVGALGSASKMWADLFLASSGVINFNAGDVTITHSANTLTFAGASSGYAFDAAITTASASGYGLVGAEGTITGNGTDLIITGGASIKLASVNTTPSVNAAQSLGSTSLGWANLHLAEGGIINWDNGDVTITQTGNTLAFAGAATSYNFDSQVQLGTFSATGVTAGFTSIPGRWNTSNTGTAGTTHGAFYNANGQVGTISTSGTTTAYNTTSDRELKQDNGEMPDGIAEQIIADVRLHDFFWKSDGKSDYGVFAQELFSVYPSAVTVGGYNDEGGNYVPWQVDYSKLVTPLLRAVQSLMQRVAALEAK